MRRLVALAVLVALAAGLFAPQVRAQVNPFEPVVVVNGSPVTAYEFFQRRQFLRALGIQGDLDRQAESALIDEKLQLAEAARLGIGVSEADLQGGMTEFAARANLSAEDFIAAIGQAGVAPETFRDFVRVGLAWRQVVRARFGAQANAVAEAEVDRALSVPAQRGVVRAEMSEIVLPARAEALADEILASIDGPEAFERAARAHSIAPSAERGGRIAPVPLSYLSPAMVQSVAQAGANALLPPARTAEGIVLLFLHGTDRFDAVGPEITEVDYLVLKPAPDPATLAGLRDCPTAYARLGDATTLSRRTLTEAALPAPHALTLARLDPGEAARVAGGEDDGALIFLCARRLVSGLSFGDGVTATGVQGERLRTGVRETLRNVRLTELAENYLRDLRADATITRP
ncbi:MAG: peptidylprolyl isomerase [Gemmobacter sp.]